MFPYRPLRLFYADSPHYNHLSSDVELTETWLHIRAAFGVRFSDHAQREKTTHSGCCKSYRRNGDSLEVGDRASCVEPVAGRPCPPKQNGRHSGEKLSLSKLACVPAVPGGLGGLAKRRSGGGHPARLR